MSTNLFICISFMFSFLIFGNYAIHLYFKNKRKLLFKSIGNQNFVEIKTINTEIFATSNLSLSWALFVSDIIIFDDKLLILLRKKIFNMNQSIIQISKKEHKEKLDGVSKVYLLEKIDFSGNKIKIKSTQYVMMKANFEIKLDFKENLKEQEAVAEFINNNWM
jgi:hypothetical protein